MASTSLFLWAAFSLSGLSLAENVDWPNAGTFFGQPLGGNGPYGFGACSDAQYTTLHETFMKVGIALEQQIIPEVNKGSQSFAFNTFFSTNGSQIPKWSQNGLSVPQEVLYDMDNGPWNRTVDGLSIANGGPVIFACKNDPDPANPNANPSASEANIKCGPGIAAARFRTNELDTSAAHWLLCDNFFNDTLYPTLPTQQMCPTWDSTYQAYLASDGNQVKDTRLGLILQLLAQIYSQNVAANRPDLQDINSAITQDFSTEIANPTNYDWFGSMVAAGCDSWPPWADPNYNATAAQEAFEASLTSGNSSSTTDPANVSNYGTKRRSVSIRGRPADGLPASDEEPKVLEARADLRSPEAPPLKPDPRMSDAARLGTIDNIPAAVKTDLKSLANIQPSKGKLGMSGGPALQLEQAPAQ